MGKLYIDFEDVKSGINDFKFNKEFDAILCVTRGGLVPAGLLSYKLEVKDVFNIKVESYTNENKQGELYVQNMTQRDISNLLLAKNILVVDDVYDSGATMIAVVEELKKYGIEDSQINTFCVITKQEEKVDYSIFECDLETWVVFPWDFE